MSELGPTYKVTISRCPTCSYSMNAATNLGGEAMPTPGSFSLCLNCGEFLRFADDLSLRVCAGRELELLEASQFAMLEKSREHILKRGRIH